MIVNGLFVRRYSIDFEQRMGRRRRSTSKTAITAARAPTRARRRSPATPSAILKIGRPAVDPMIGVARRGRTALWPTSWHTEPSTICDEYHGAGAGFLLSVGSSSFSSKNRRHQSSMTIRCGIGSEILMGAEHISKKLSQASEVARAGSSLSCSSRHCSSGRARRGGAALLRLDQAPAPQPPNHFTSICSSSFSMMKTNFFVSHSTKMGDSCCGVPKAVRAHGGRCFSNIVALSAWPSPLSRLRRRSDSRCACGRTRRTTRHVEFCQLLQHLAHGECPRAAKKYRIPMAATMNTTMKKMTQKLYVADQNST